MNEMKLDVYQHDELYNCRVYSSNDDDNMHVNIRSDKVKIIYNTSKERFVVKFLNGGRQIAEADVDWIYLYDIKKENRISFPEIESVWPYERVIIDMADERV